MERRRKQSARGANFKRGSGARDAGGRVISAAAGAPSGDDGEPAFIPNASACGVAAGGVRDDSGGAAASSAQIPIVAASVALPGASGSVTGVDAGASVDESVGTSLTYPDYS